MEKKELICITCPMGCSLTAERENPDQPWQISGNSCKRGVSYATAELTHPVRTLTSTVRVANRPGKYLAVKTSAPISKEKMFEAMDILRSTTVQAPVSIGQVILKDLLGEANVVAAAEIR